MVRSLTILLLFFSHLSFAQQFIFPDSATWRHLKEGQLLTFQVKVDDPITPKFSLEGNTYGISFDSLGNFSWKPPYSFVDRVEKKKEISLIFQAAWKNDRKISTTVNLIVHHENRPPEVDELPTFYVRQSTLNKYQISSNYVRDLDGDPLVYNASLSKLPEGMSLSSFGLLTWTPSQSQFKSLKNNPMYIEFTVQDQPEKAEAKGKIKIAQTQLDLPSEILLVPGDTSLTIKENEHLNFKIYISDPNGDDDVSSVGFISSDNRILRNCLKENTSVQYEFTWMPGYKFTDDAAKSITVEIIFFVVDKSNNRVQRKVSVKVMDTENVEERDKLLFLKYKGTLSSVKSLIGALNVRHKELEREYKRAKKGKTNRSILSASMGAGTGASPSFVTNPNSLKTVTVIGGSAIGLLGGLEAGNVLGRSKNDVMDLIKTETDLRTQLQLSGDAFARKYALKSNRRLPEFDADRDKFLPLLNNQSLPSLELDASILQRVYELREMKKTFADYSDE